MGRIREQTDGQRWRDDDGRERGKEVPEEDRSEERQEEYYRLTCATCGIPFKMPRHLADRRYEDHRSFHCPNGHSNYWPELEPQPTPDEEKERLRSQVGDLQAKVRELEEDRGILRKRVAEEKENAGYWEARFVKSACLLCRLTRWWRKEKPRWFRRKGR